MAPLGLRKPSEFDELLTEHVACVCVCVSLSLSIYIYTYINMYISTVCICKH